MQDNVAKAHIADQSIAQSRLHVMQANFTPTRSEGAIAADNLNNLLRSVGGSFQRDASGYRTMDGGRNSLASALKPERSTIKKSPLGLSLKALRRIRRRLGKMDGKLTDEVTEIEDTSTSLGANHQPQSLQDNVNDESQRPGWAQREILPLPQDPSQLAGGNYSSQSANSQQGANDPQSTGTFNLLNEHSLYTDSVSEWDQLIREFPNLDLEFAPDDSDSLRAHMQMNESQMKTTVEKNIHIVRFGETLRSIALSHPALGDVSLWPLLAEKNQLSTERDANDRPVAKLTRGTRLLIPTPKEISAFRTRQIAIWLVQSSVSGATQ
jgi:hypothetical protein